jgi:hypothetical protein
MQPARQALKELLHDGDRAVHLLEADNVRTVQDALQVPLAGLVLRGVAGQGRCEAPAIPSRKPESEWGAA